MAKKVNPNAAAAYIAARTAEITAAIERREILADLWSAGKTLKIVSANRSYLLRVRNPQRHAEITKEMKARLERVRAAKAEIIKR